MGGGGNAGKGQREHGVNRRWAHGFSDAGVKATPGWALSWRRGIDGENLGSSVGAGEN